MLSKMGRCEEMHSGASGGDGDVGNWGVEVLAAMAGGSYASPSRSLKVRPGLAR